ncbi:MAG: hypothetical protein WCT53_04935 [Candidatus Gracilibacteria bacterium]
MNGDGAEAGLGVRNIEGAVALSELLTAPEEPQRTAEELARRFSTCFEVDLAMWDMSELKGNRDLSQMLVPVLEGILSDTPGKERSSPDKLQRHCFERLAINFRSQLSASLKQNNLRPALFYLVLYVFNSRALGKPFSNPLAYLEIIEERIAAMANGEQNQLSAILERLKGFPPFSHALKGLPQTTFAPSQETGTRPPAKLPAEEGETPPVGQPELVPLGEMNRLIAESRGAQLQRDWESVVNLQRQILKIAADQRKPMVVLIRGLINIGRTDEALECLSWLERLSNLNDMDRDFIRRAYCHIRDLKQGEGSGTEGMQDRSSPTMRQLIGASIRFQRIGEWEKVIIFQKQIIEELAKVRRAKAGAIIILIRALGRSGKIDEAADWLGRLERLPNLTAEDRGFIERTKLLIEELRQGAGSPVEDPTAGKPDEPAQELAAKGADVAPEIQTLEFKTLKDFLNFLKNNAERWPTVRDHSDWHVIPQPLRRQTDSAWLGFNRTVHKCIDSVAERNFWNCIGSAFGLATGKLHAINSTQLQELLTSFQSQIDFIDAFISVPVVVKEEPAADEALMPSLMPTEEPPIEPAPASAELQPLVGASVATELEPVAPTELPPAPEPPVDEPEPPTKPLNGPELMAQIRGMSREAEEAGDWETAAELRRQLIQLAEKNGQPVAASTQKLIRALINLGDPDGAEMLLVKLPQLSGFDVDRGAKFVAHAASHIEGLRGTRAHTESPLSLPPAVAVKSKPAPRTPAASAPEQNPRPTCLPAAPEERTETGLNIDYSRFDRMLESLARELGSCEMHEQGELWRVLPEPDAEKLTGVLKYKKRDCLRNYPDDPHRFPHPDNIGQRTADKKKKGKREEKPKRLKSLHSQFWKEFGAVEEMIHARLVHIEAVHRLIKNLPEGINDQGE